ncbi:hypothetical protein HOY80DRAFT_481724 [Tuber brumale]|nr:hypothetical protein HOY80DRAFT_481724 [Tuber brumale]
MTTAAKVQCIANFSRVSLSPALPLQRGLSAQLHRRFVSSSSKDEEAVAKLDLESKQIYASNFMNESGLNPSEFGNSLTAGTMMTPSTGVLEQSVIIDAGSRPICLDMQATTPTAPRVIDAILSLHTGLYGNPNSCAHTYGWERTKPIEVACQQSANLIGPHPKEIEKPCRMNRAFFCTHGPQSADNIPIRLGKWNDDLTSIFGPKVYGPKDIGAHNNTHHIPKVRIVPLRSGRGQERGIHSGTYAHSQAFAFGEPSRMSPEKIHYTRTSHPVFSLSSTRSSTVRDNYIHQSYRNKISKIFTRTFRTMSHNAGDTKTGKHKPTVKDSMAEIRAADSTGRPNAMAHDPAIHPLEVLNTKAVTNTHKNRRNLKRGTSYSRMTISEAEARLGLRLNLSGIPVKRMLEGKRALLAPDILLKLKTKIYQDLVTYMALRGYPIEATADSTEATINDIVFFTIYHIIAQFNDETKQNLRLAREKEITTTDSRTGGREEFVVMDLISCIQKKYVLAVEAKNTSVGEAIKHCFLALKDMRDYNGGGTVYGFVTQGDSWRMISFDGTFTLSKKIELLFDDMGENQKEWMADYSTIVECFNVALSNGGKGPLEVV